MTRNIFFCFLPQRRIANVTGHSGTQKSIHLTTASLAPHSRFAALLARRARLQNPTMALVEVAGPYPPKKEKQPFQEPPSVITTPADPWPRPYVLEDGLRKVAPYHFTYNTYCKQRWRGRELLDIFASEFRDRPLEYYVCTMLEHQKLHTDSIRKML
jgi:hypothetical protein